MQWQNSRNLELPLDEKLLRSIVLTQISDSGMPLMTFNKHWGHIQAVEYMVMNCIRDSDAAVSVRDLPTIINVHSRRIEVLRGTFHRCTRAAVRIATAFSLVADKNQRTDELVELASSLELSDKLIVLCSGEASGARERLTNNALASSPFYAAVAKKMHAAWRIPAVHAKRVMLDLCR